MKSPKALVLEEIRRFVNDVPETMIKEVPPDIAGDFSFPCFAHAKKEGKRPDEFAEKLAKDIGHGGFIKKAEANNGFVNISLNAGKVADIYLDAILEMGEDYGKGEAKGSIILEHTSANPNAPLHIGHIRNSIIGDTMTRILRFAGYDVEAQFLVNDMGGQLAILASYLSGRHYEKEMSAFEGKPDEWLGEAYVRANGEVDPEVAKALQKNYERGNKETRRIFDFMVKSALSGFKETMKDYSIRMDSFVRESDFVFGGAVSDIIESFKKTPFWFEKEGMSAIDLEEYGIKKELVLLRSDGTSLYTTRDLAYHKWKLTKSDRCINVIANEQTLQQRQLRAGLEILGIKDAEERIRHLSYELVTVPGMRMSSRTGEFISADELLKEGIHRATNEISKRNLDLPLSETKKIAREVAKGAVRFNMIKISPLKPIEFRWEEALSFEGDSSPYLQYSHARAKRIMEKTQGGEKTKLSKIDFSEEESKLVILLSDFPKVISSASKDLKPNLLANYLLSLAESFNRFYFKCPVIESEEELRSARIMLVRAFIQIMSNGLKLLGIEPLERM